MALKLIIVTAPSGAGKTTIVRHLLDKFDNLAFSISATTRRQRPDEVDGRDYYFLTVDDFRRRIEHGDFVEWEEVYQDQFYGTLKSELERIESLKKNVVFDIDVKGALNIKKQYPDNSLSIFIKPPSLDILGNRLSLRETEDEDSIRKRLDRAKLELSYADKFDQVIVNDKLRESLREADKLVDDFLLSNGAGHI